jgi:hypothetical protein
MGMIKAIVILVVVFGFGCATNAEWDEGAAQSAQTICGRDLCAVGDQYEVDLPNLVPTPPVPGQFNYSVFFTSLPRVVVATVTVLGDFSGGSSCAGVVLKVNGQRCPTECRAQHASCSAPVNVGQFGSSGFIGAFDSGVQGLAGVSITKASAVIRAHQMLPSPPPPVIETEVDPTPLPLPLD